MIAKADLIHGAYYEGHCRNATVARWDGARERFRHWRSKFGSRFLEDICHPDDDARFDVFTPEALIDATGLVEIPLEMPDA